MTGVGDPTRLSVSGSSPGFFRVLGVPPARGRDFTPAEQPDSADSHVIISDGLWRDRFASDPNAVGRTLELDGVRQTIIGVMPADFDFPSGTRIWRTAPIYPNPNRVSIRQVVGRIAPGVTPAAALSEMQAFMKAFDQPRAGSSHRATGGRCHPDPPRDRRRRAALATPLRRRGGVRAAHRVRERGESAAHEDRGAAARDHDPHRARRRTRAG